MKTKKDIATHFRRRCIERLGHPISYDRLFQMMRQQRLQFVRRQSLTRTIWRMPEKELAEIGIERAGHDVTIVYDKLRHGFVTVMVSARK